MNSLDICICKDKWLADSATDQYALTINPVKRENPKTSVKRKIENGGGSGVVKWVAVFLFTGQHRICCFTVRNGKPLRTFAYPIFLGVVSKTVMSAIRHKLVLLLCQISDILLCSRLSYKKIENSDLYLVVYVGTNSENISPVSTPPRACLYWRTQADLTRVHPFRRGTKLGSKVMWLT